jgi:hypothetical protein
MVKKQDVAACVPAFFILIGFLLWHSFLCFFALAFFFMLL